MSSKSFLDVQSRERFSDGTWILNAFFQALAVNRNESDARFAAASEKIARWLASHPASSFALVAQAGYQLNLAWHARAAETSAGREEARRAVTRAREILEANPAAKVVPEYFVKMEWVAFEQGWTREAFSQVFEEAIARERDYYTTYFQAAYFLLDGVRSERGGWERFAEEQRRRRGGEEGDALYTRIAWSMSVNYRDLFGKSAISWEIMAAGFQRLMRDYPESRWLKNAYANFAWKADDRERLRPALAAIEADPDMGIWVNLANVESAKKFAAGR